MFTIADAVHLLSPFIYNKKPTFIYFKQWNLWI